MHYLLHDRNTVNARWSSTAPSSVWRIGSSFQLTTLIEATSAREKVYTEFEAADAQPSSLVRPPPPVTDSQSVRHTRMNPMATEFDPGSQSIVLPNPELNAVQ